MEKKKEEKEAYATEDPTDNSAKIGRQDKRGN